MGTENQFTKVKLFCGFIYSQNGIYEEIKNLLEKKFSPVDLESKVFKFDKTTYYNKEMGTALFKRFVSFRNLITPEELPDIKLYTNVLENENRISGNRLINIDPGYLSNANVILATTKNHFHRIPLAKGIYAHMEYILKKEIITLEWTYPDFRTEEYIKFFTCLKELYKRKG